MCEARLGNADEWTPTVKYSYCRSNARQRRLAPGLREVRLGRRDLVAMLLAPPRPAYCADWLELKVQGAAQPDGAAPSEALLSPFEEHANAGGHEL